MEIHCSPAGLVGFARPAGPSSAATEIKSMVSEVNHTNLNDIFGKLIYTGAIENIRIK
jgi:hypothetical protein